MHGDKRNEHQASPAGGAAGLPAAAPATADDRPRFTEADPIEADAADHDGETLIRGIDGIGYALATTDDATGVWYVARSGSLGNPMRTRVASNVRIWHSPGAVRDWISSLPELTRRRMAARRLTIIPLRIALMFGEEFESIHLAARPTEGDPADGAAEYVLCYRPPGRRSRRAGSGGTERERRQP
jgi:hypothetical protein